MKFNPDKHHRRSIRLRGYNYAQAGAYFVTVCVRDRECLFGNVVDGEMRLNEMGQIVDKEWQMTTALRTDIDLDIWIIMPNHVHGIVVIGNIDKTNSPVGAYSQAPLGVLSCHRQESELRGACAPTFTFENNWRDYTRIQIRHNKTYKRMAPDARPSGLATQLPRTHHSKRRFVGSHSAIHRRQPHALGV